MTSPWKRALFSAEIAAHVVAPIQHPALEQAHLEPAMTDQQYSQEIELQQQKDAAEIQLEERRAEVERATTRPSGRGTVAAPSARSTPVARERKDQTEPTPRHAVNARQRSEATKVASPARDRKSE
jgi:hypothetical protein